jgi:two-component system chemotaxis response regulator CheB
VKKRRQIIVVGASAGGVQALKTLFSTLPSDFPGVLFIVLHLTPHSHSSLPQILTNMGGPTAKQAVEGEAIVHGQAYVAPPNRHLLVAAGHVHLSAGPKENRTRPAINPLFRSASLAYGPQVIGVILSGNLDDGTLGLWEIKRRGGIAVVQEPAGAEHAQMARSALANVDIDYRAELEKIGPLLVDLANEEIDLNQEGSEELSRMEHTNLTCPECHGPLHRITHGSLVELKCRVGHAYSPQSAMLAHDDAEERILWSAAEALEEGAEFIGTLSEHLPENLKPGTRQAEKRRMLAGEIRTILAER